MSGMTSSSNVEISDLLTQTIVLSNELLCDILYQINNMTSFCPEKEFHWNHEIMALTSDISKFVEITTLMSKVIMSKKKQTFPEIKNSHIHLLFILKAMNQAQQKLDLVALEELIMYELKDNLTQWKIDLIPQTKRLLNTSHSI
jgi:hypothetical protein